MAHLGDLTAAIDVLRQALDLCPDWAAGWFRLGEWYEAAGDVEAAVDAWNRSVRADPADPLGAGLKRDLARRVPIVETLPPAFVELLFDQYAPRFDRSLVERLDYRGPQIVAAALDAAGFEKALRALDLGCGTGLAGVALRPRCDWLEGIDISTGMLAEAAAKGDYDRLTKANIATLELGPERWDLIVAVDVFIYLGALERVMAWCAGSLAPGGMLAFTVELGDSPVALQDSRRFAHSREYVAGLLHNAGLAAVSLHEVTLRTDRGAPVASLCVVAQADATRLDRTGDGEMALSD